MDMKLNEKIVKLCGNIDNCYVCEVGPGPGGITRAILNKDIKHLYVIEKDKRFFPGLQVRCKNKIYCICEQFFIELYLNIYYVF